jgi:hypothetical protein
MFSPKSLQNGILHYIPQKSLIMKNTLLLTFLSFSLTTTLTAQKLKSAQVPEAVKNALLKKYPSASNVTWEKEKGNFEANWGGRSKEDNSVLFTPDGTFVETVVAIPIADLPLGIATYIKAHYPGSKITEAGKVTDAKGNTSYEAEVKGKDLLFDKEGNFKKIAP